MSNFADSKNSDAVGQVVVNDEPHASTELPKGGDVVIETNSNPPASDASEEDRAAFLSTFTPSQQKKIIRKVDYRILVTIGLIYMIKQIDVDNLSSVKVLQPGQKTNILKQLNMTADEYNWAQSIYYVSYIVFETPCNLFLKRMTPRLFQSRIALLWGTVLACHAAVHNKQGLYAARFILGVMNAGMYPALITHICSWYRTDEIIKPIMWMFAIYANSSILGSLLVYGISYMDGMRGLSAWQWVFIIEGVVTILWSGVLFFILPDYPMSKRTSKWLTPREQKFVELRLADNAPKASDHSFSKAEILDTLKDPKLWLFSFAHLLQNISQYGLTWFLPTITTDLGFTTPPRNQLLNIAPAAASVIGIIFVAVIVIRAYVQRARLVLTFLSLEIACYIIFATTDSRGAIYTACILGKMFATMVSVPFWAWRSSTLKGTTGTAFAAAFQTSLANTGGVVAPQLFQSKYAYNGYKVSFGVCAGAASAGLILNAITWFLTRKNEDDVFRIRKQRIRAEREGRLYTEEDVHVDDQRNLFGIFKKSNQTV